MGHILRYYIYLEFLSGTFIYFRIVWNRAADNIRAGDQKRPPNEALSPSMQHSNSPNGEVMQRGGTYSITGILGIPNQPQNISDQNAVKRKREDQQGSPLCCFIKMLILLVVIGLYSM